MYNSEIPHNKRQPSDLPVDQAVPINQVIIFSPLPTGGTYRFGLSSSSHLTLFNNIHNYDRNYISNCSHMIMITLFLHRDKLSKAFKCTARELREFCIFRKGIAS